MLESLGVDAAEERLYEDLLAHPNSTLDDLADRADVLARLVGKHLVRSDDGRYNAVPPELALRGALDARRLELDQAAARVRQLELLHRATPDPDRRAPVEVVPPAMVQDYLNALHAATRSEVRAFETPPYGKAIQPADAQPAVGAIGRGVRHRIVYSRAAVEHQGLETLRLTLSVGEQARVVGEVPLRLAIYDDQAASMPLLTGRRQTEGAFVIRPSSLLDALIALFEQVWAGAAPLHLDEPAGDAETDDRVLIALLAAGMGDQAIARQLGVSLRTVGRRVQRIQTGLNAATRFQAGVAIGLAKAAGQVPPAADRSRPDSGREPVIADPNN